MGSLLERKRRAAHKGRAPQLSACKAEGSGLHIVRISLEDDGPIGMDHPTTLAQDIMPRHSRLADLGAVVRVAPLPGPGRTGTRYEIDLPT